MSTGVARRWMVGLIGATALLAAACGGGEGAAERDPGPAAAPVGVARAAVEAMLTEAVPTKTMPTETMPAAAVVIGAETVGAVATPAPAPEPAPPDPITIPITVALDPGHGGIDPGAAGFGIDEAASNLDLARRAEALLVAEGYRVVLTRQDESGAVGFDPTAVERLHPFAARRADLQTRVDLVNAAEADLLVSIHSNAHDDAGLRGVEVYYDPDRPFGEENRRIAGFLGRRVIEALADYGYAAADRGALDDSCWRQFDGRCRPLFLLGPARPIQRSELEQRGLDPAQFGFGPDQEVLTTRASAMPAALVEVLFLSHEADAAVLGDEAGRDAIARGIAQAVIAFFAGQRSTG